MNKLLACISHKGGTGRTVSTANIAYHLARRGRDVCILDLDLASPTLGAVVGLDNIAAGAKVGIHNILTGELQPEKVSELERNVWESPDINEHYRPEIHGKFCVVPGTRTGGDAVMGTDNPEARSRLSRVLTDLGSRYEYVFCDLRSGIGPVSEAFLWDRIAYQLHSWLLFYRWTHQHLHGVEDLAIALSENTDRPLGRTNPRFLSVRTAVIEIGRVPSESRTWIAQRHDRLRERSRRLEASTEPPLENVGTIPLDLVLQWSESILTLEHAAVVGNSDTLKAFENLAAILDEMADTRRA